MHISVVGVNHRNAPVELREKLAIESAALASALDGLRSALHSSEEVIVSTCNRVELYLVTESAGNVLEPVAAFLATNRRRPLEEVRPVLYCYTGEQAVRHLFEVTSSLDSMVLGETQIIAQVKQAYFVSKDAGHTGRIFNPLFQRALGAAKRIHSSTSIGERSVSVPSVAAKLAEKIFQELSGKRVLIVGAGETGALTLQAFRERGVRDVTVVNRSVAHARELAATIGGTGHGLDELAAVLPQADVVITCLAVEQPVIGMAEVRQALRVRRNTPIFFIDLGVPRNVDDRVDEFDNAYLYNVDDLQTVVSQNLLERQREVAECAPVIEEETASALQEIAQIDVQDILVKLRAAIEGIGDEELKRTLAKVPTLPEEQRREVEELVHRLVGKFLHSPTMVLKEEASNGHAPVLVRLIARLFDIK